MFLPVSVSIGTCTTSITTIPRVSVWLTFFGRKILHHHNDYQAFKTTTATSLSASLSPSMSYCLLLGRGREAFVSYMHVSLL